MTTNEAILTLVQQQAKVAELIEIALANTDNITDDLRKEIDDIKEEIKTNNETLYNFFYKDADGNTLTYDLTNNSLPYILTLLGSTDNKMLKYDANIKKDYLDLVRNIPKNYATFYNLANTVYTFLEATDTKDTTINTWKEIERFLSGLQDTDNLTSKLFKLEQNVNNNSAHIDYVDHNMTSMGNSIMSNLNNAIGEVNGKIYEMDTNIHNLMNKMNEINIIYITTNDDNSNVFNTYQKNPNGTYIRFINYRYNNTDDRSISVKIEYKLDDTLISEVFILRNKIVRAVVTIDNYNIEECTLDGSLVIENNSITENKLSDDLINKLNKLKIFDVTVDSDNTKLVEYLEDTHYDCLVRYINNLYEYFGQEVISNKKHYLFVKIQNVNKNGIFSYLDITENSCGQGVKYIENKHLSTDCVTTKEIRDKSVTEPKLSDDVAVKLNQIRIFEVTSTSDNTEVINAYKANPDNVFVKLNTGSQVFVLKVTHWQGNDVNSNLVTERANVGGTERFILINTTGYSLGDVSFNLDNIPTITKNKLSADLQNTINQLDLYTSIENIDNIIKIGTYIVGQTNSNGATIPNLLQVMKFNNNNQIRQTFYNLTAGAIKYRVGTVENNVATWGGWSVVTLDGYALKNKSVTEEKLSQDIQDAIGQLTTTIDISQIDYVKKVGTYIVTKKVNNPVSNDLTVACLLQVCEPIKNFIRQVFYDLSAGVIKYRGINDNNIWTDWVNFKWNAASLNIDVETNADPKSTAATTDNSVTTRLTSTNGRLYPKVKLHSYDASRDISETATNLVEEKALAKHLKELDNKFSTPAQVDARFNALVGAAPEALDTLEEIAAKIQDGDDIHTALVNDIAGKIGKDDLTIDCAPSVQEDGHTKVRVIGKVDGVEKTAGAFHIKSINGNQLVGTGDLKLDIPDLKVFQVTVDSDNTELITYCNSADYHNNVIILYNSNVFVPYTINATGVNTNYVLNAHYGCISLNITANAVTRITGNVNGAVLSKDTVTLNHLAPNLKHPYQIIGMDKLDTATDNGFYLVQNGINEDGAGSQYPLWLQVMNMLGGDTNINYCRQCLYDGYVGIFKVRMKPDTSTNWGEWKYLNLDGTYIKDGSITKDKLADDMGLTNHYFLILNAVNEFVEIIDSNQQITTTGLIALVRKFCSDNAKYNLTIKYNTDIIRLERIMPNLYGDNPIVIASMIDYDTLSKTYFKITIGDTPAECTVESKTINII